MQPSLYWISKVAPATKIGWRFLLPVPENKQKSTIHCDAPPHCRCVCVDAAFVGGLKLQGRPSFACFFFFQSLFRAGRESSRIPRTPTERRNGQVKIGPPVSQNKTKLQSLVWILLSYRNPLLLKPRIMPMGMENRAVDCAGGDQQCMIKSSYVAIMRTAE